MLIGDRIILDAIDPEDIEWMRQQRNDPELRRYFREWKDISRDQQADWYRSRGNNSDPNHVYFKIMQKHEKKPGELWDRHKLIGCCGLHYIDWRLRSAEFGVFLDLKCRGKGMGKEAIHMLFDFGFKEMNLHKIWCEVYDNNAAIDFYRALGFVQEGVLRDSYFCEGKYGNSIVMSVLENEWAAKQSRE